MTAITALMNVTNSTIKQKGALENDNTAIFTYTAIDSSTFDYIANATVNLLSLAS